MKFKLDNADKYFWLGALTGLLAIFYMAVVARGLDIDPRDYNTPQEAATVIRTYCSIPNRTVVLKKGVYDFGNPPNTLPSQNWQMQAGTQIKCPTKDAVLRHNAIYSNSAGCQFGLNDGVVIDGVTFDNYSPIYEQSVTVGFGLPMPTFNNCTAYINNCTITGNTHSLYIWSGNGNHIIARNDIIRGGRFVCGIGSSGSGACALMDLIGCEINADGALSTYDPLGSQVEMRVHGVYFRGGIVNVRNCVINCVGTPAYKDVRGIWAPTTDNTNPGHEGGNVDGRCYVYDTAVRVQANGATGDVVDLQSGSGQLQSYGGSGSDPGGKYRTIATAPGVVVTNP